MALKNVKLTDMELEDQIDVQSEEEAEKASPPISNIAEVNPNINNISLNSVIADFSVPREEATIIREVELRVIDEANSFVKRNEKFNNGKPFAPDRQYRITPKINKHGINVVAFENYEESKHYMSKILGVSPTEPSYENKVAAFWKNVLILVDRNGLKFNISFRLHLGKTIKNGYYNKLTGKSVDIIVSKDSFLAAPEDQKYLYGDPINLTHYWQYRYCLNTSQVANSKQIYLDKRGKNMEFYLYTEEEEMAALEKTVKLIDSAQRNRIATMGRPEMIEYILRYFERGRSTRDGYSLNIGTFSFDSLREVEKSNLLIEVSNKYPAKFIELSSDINAEYRILIYKAINVNVIREEAGNTILFMGDEIIANSIDELVAVLKKNDKLTNDIRIRIKATEARKSL